MRTGTVGTESVHAAAQAVYSPDGTTLAVAGTDVAVLNAVTGQLIRSLPSTTPNAVAYSPDSKTLAVTSRDGQTQLWDLTTGQPIGNPLSGGNGSYNGLAFSPDGSLLAVSAGGGTQLWSTPAAIYGAVETPPTTLDTDGSRLQFSHDGTALAVEQIRDGLLAGGITVYNTATGTMTASIPVLSSVIAMAFSPNDDVLAVGGEQAAQRWKLGASPAPTGSPISFTTQLGSDPVAISPGGTSLVAILKDNRLTFWDLRERQPLAVSLGTTAYSGAMEVMALAISPDGKTLAVGTASGTQIWSLVTRSQVGKMLTTGDVVSLAFTPDGRNVAVGTNAGVQLWNIDSGQPNGADFAASHGDFSTAFSPDGSVLAVAAVGGTQLWDVGTRQLIGSMPPDDGDGGVYLQFSPRGNTLATGILFGSAQLWNLDYLQPARTPGYVCAQAGQTFTPAQWKQYAPGTAYQDVCPGE